MGFIVFYLYNYCTTLKIEYNCTKVVNYMCLDFFSQGFEEERGLGSSNKTRRLQQNIVTCVEHISSRYTYKLAEDELNNDNFLIGEPSTDPTHVDYVPALFVFTREEQRTALGKRVKKHEQIIAMKKKRLDGLKPDERKVMIL